jgi:MoxR-like ATPase
LDTREIQTVTGETVRAADGVFIIAADNTAGMGDDSGRFVDTAPVNAAFLDRFALRVEFSYLSEGQETTMLAARTGVPSEAARIMVEYANLTRQNSDAGKLTMGVTPRRLLAWARAAKAGIASAKAFSASVITGSAPEDKEVLIMLEGQTLRSQHAQIDNIVRGIVSEPSMAPSAAGLAFPEENDTL